jgi:hypothetical protein
MPAHLGEHDLANIGPCLNQAAFVATDEKSTYCACRRATAKAAACWPESPPR